jgi:hypothetical protein
MTTYRQLVVSEQFGPDELIIVAEVFDAVWSTVQYDFAG